jgi:hypothetical protein
MADDSEEKKNAFKVIFVGDDKSYFGLIKDKFASDFKAIKLEYEQLYKETGMEIQSLIVDIFKKKPRIIFVDLSKHTSEMLHLARVLARLNSVIKPQIFALADYNQGITPLQRAVIAGVRCVHIKGAELDAVCFDAIAFAFPDKLENHDFAMAKLEDSVNAYIPVKVGIVSTTGVRVESNFPVAPGNQYNLLNFWTNKGLMKSSGTQCKSQIQEGLYYNYDFSQEFAFEYVAPVDKEDKEPDVIEQLEKERLQVLEESKSRMIDWVKNNPKFSKLKVLKTLIVDKDMTIYKDQPLSDEFSFVIRCQPYLHQVKKELTHINPHLIVYNMEDVDPEELEANEDIAHTYNETRTLQYILKVIHSMQGYTPFIIVFNAEGYSTDKLQKVLNYSQIMAYSEKLNVELVHKMATMLDKKLNSQYQSATECIYLEKEHPSSYAEIEIDIELVGCSENDLYFNAAVDLPYKTVLRVNLPAPMYVSVTSAPNGSTVSSDYYGLIHGIGEEERQELRRFINSVFFREKEAARAAEKEAFEQAKIDAIKRKEEEAQKAAEEAQRLKEEEEKAKQEAEAQAEELKKQKEREALASEDGQTPPKPSEE